MVLRIEVTAALMILLIIPVHVLIIDYCPKRPFLLLWDLVMLRLLFPFEALMKWTLPSKVFDMFGSNETISRMMLVSNFVQENTGNLQMDVREMGLVVEKLSPAKIDAATPERIFIVIWLVVFVLLLAALITLYIVSYRRFSFAWEKQNAYLRGWRDAHPLKRDYRIRFYPGINSPLTYGVLRPVILLPADCDLENEAGLHYVLQHEWTHICHLDTLRKMISYLVVCLHWFNPLVWLMTYFINKDIELACDEGVLKATNEDERKQYALTLITLEAAKDSSFLVSYFGTNALPGRIRAIMKKSRVRSSGRLAVYCLIAVTGIVGFVRVAFAAAPLSGNDDALYGTYVMDVGITDEHTGGSESVRDLFGKFSAGARLTLDENLNVEFELGLGAHFVGQIVEGDSIYHGVVVDQHGAISGEQEITLYRTSVHDEEYMVMECMDQNIYWKKVEVLQ